MTCTRCKARPALLEAIAVLGCAPSIDSQDYRPRTAQAARQPEATKIARWPTGHKLCARCAATVKLQDVLSLGDEANLRTMFRHHRQLQVIHKVLGWRPIKGAEA